MRPLIVGELNGYSSASEFDLYPLPENASGGRLCRILGISASHYLETFDRVNLCRGQWDRSAAREAAQEIALEPREVVILLGRKVADAFGLSSAETLSRAGRYVLLPHPSGRCLLWNVRQNVERARQLVTEALSAAKQHGK